MSLTIQERKIFFSNVEEISTLLNVSEQKTIIEKYLSDDLVSECVQVCQSVLDKTEALCMELVRNLNKELYDSFLEYFFNKSERYRRLYEKMANARTAQRSNDFIAAETTTDGLAKDQFEKLTDDLHALKEVVSNLNCNHCSSENHVQPDEKSLQAEVCSLQKKLKELEEERIYWRSGSAFLSNESANSVKLSETILIRIQQSESSIEEMKSSCNKILESLRQLEDVARSGQSIVPPDYESVVHGCPSFSYTIDMKERAEKERFGYWKLPSILCSLQGEFIIDWNKMGCKSMDYKDDWMNMVNGDDIGLGWYIMMPEKAHGVIVWMTLWRSGADCIIKAQYQCDTDCSIPAITVRFDMQFLFHKENGGTLTIKDNKRGEITHDCVELLRIRGLDWHALDKHMFPIVTLKLLSIS